MLIRTLQRIQLAFANQMLLTIGRVFFASRFWRVCINDCIVPLGVEVNCLIDAIGDFDAFPLWTSWCNGWPHFAV